MLNAPAPAGGAGTVGKTVMDEVGKEFNNVTQVLYESFSRLPYGNTNDIVIPPKTLKYYKKGEVHTVDINGDAANNLHELGYLRFNTVYIRNVIWISSLFRVMRNLFRRNSTYYKDKVVSNLPATAAGITELYGHDEDNMGPNGEYRY